MSDPFGANESKSARCHGDGVWESLFTVLEIDLLRQRRLWETRDTHLCEENPCDLLLYAFQNDVTRNLKIYKPISLSISETVSTPQRSVSSPLMDLDIFVISIPATLWYSIMNYYYDDDIIASMPPSRVNLALAYTELTEELGRLQALSCKQTEILRKASQEHSSPG